MTTKNDPNRLLTTGEVALLLGYSKSAIKQSRCTGTLGGKDTPAPPYIQLGRKKSCAVRYVYKDVVEWILKNSIKVVELEKTYENIDIKERLEFAQDKIGEIREYLREIERDDKGRGIVFILEPLEDLADVAYTVCDTDKSQWKELSNYYGWAP